ncbi:MAG: hypothetical protein PVJ53_13825 [Desulfobacterales bacterium]|jgi:hypothetical protein
MQKMPINEANTKVALEREKLRNTSHWDLDYLPMQEVEALYANQVDSSEDTEPLQHKGSSWSKRMLGLFCIAGGLVLLAMVIIAAQFYAQ